MSRWDKKEQEKPRVAIRELVCFSCLKPNKESPDDLYCRDCKARKQRKTVAVEIYYLTGEMN